MKRLILKHTLALAAALGLICGWLAVEATAQVYLSYASGSEMLLVIGTASKSGVTAALQNYPGRTLVVYDTAGKTATAEIKAWEGGATSLGTEILADTGFDAPGSWTPQAGWAVSGSSAAATAADASCYQTKSVTYKSLVRAVFTVTNYSAGSVLVGIGHGGAGQTDGTPRNSTGTFEQYLTSMEPTVPDSVALRGSGFTGVCDDFSIKQVTSPGSNGVRLGPVTMESGFAPNSIGYWQIQAPPSDPRGTERLKGNAVVFDSRYQ
jgi:roadblock/LC7 domain-containing protein